jgi:hypothetical protein
LLEKASNMSQISLNPSAGLFHDRSKAAWEQQITKLKTLGLWLKPAGILSCSKLKVTVSLLHLGKSSSFRKSGKIGV